MSGKLPPPEERPTAAELAATASESEAKHGIRCRECGCRDFRVRYTRRQEGRIMRRRYCRHCGKQITTYEKEITND